MRAFEFEVEGGSYWSVIDDDYNVVGPADEYLYFLRFGRGCRPGTIKKYAESLALYFSFVQVTNREWTSPNLPAFHHWLMVTPSRQRRDGPMNVVPGPGTPRVRGNSRINQISVCLCELFKHQVSLGNVAPSVLNALYEVVTDESLPAVLRGERTTPGLRARRRHRLPVHIAEAPVLNENDLDAVLNAAGNTRDLFLLLILVLCGLRRGEALGLRREDLHFLPSSEPLGCNKPGAHLHVRYRENPNNASAKSRDERWVPVPSQIVDVHTAYDLERWDCQEARESDLVFVNLYREPRGAPMQLWSVDELFERLSRHVGRHVTAHMLRHTFATEAATRTTLDVVQKLLGHRSILSTQRYLHPSPERLRRAIESDPLLDLLESTEP